METIILIIFVVGYLAITLEHNLKLDKLIPALLMMALIWAAIALGLDDFTTWFDSTTHSLMDGFGSLPHHAGEAAHGAVDAHGNGHAELSKMQVMEQSILHHLGKTAEILFFLMGAMTIVEIIDDFDGFSTIKNAIKTTSKKRLLWIFAILAFILSAIIDNLTATIVLITILQKVIKDKETRLWFAGLIVIAANAGGAWSPIGDVTTTMLWIGKKVTVGHLVGYLLLPSLICMAIPVFIASTLKPFQGDLPPVEADLESESKSKYSSTMLFMGLGGILFVPIFKLVTHLPPYVGMMLSLSVVGLFAEIYSRTEYSLSTIKANPFHSPVHKSLAKIEMPSILFFLGILMAVAGLESLGLLYNFANGLKENVPLLGTELHHEGVSDLVILLLGVGSAVVDNVPLVAASLGMFSEPIDNEIWHFIAYSAGTGGSMLIIGSAAGVVAMGMEKINFMWYLKKISWLAALGFIAGAIAFMWTRTLF